MHGTTIKISFEVQSEFRHCDKVTNQSDRPNFSLLTAHYSFSHVDPA